jgi:Uma2 family endonuclease
MERVPGQGPIDAAIEDRERNVPEPDIALLKTWSPEFGRRHPRGAELRLIVEISDSTLYSDMTGKRGLYARAEVPDYWVIDLNGRSIDVYRAPSEGKFTQNSTLNETGNIVLDGNSIAISKLLP